jgi:TatD DNase family protein
MQYSLNALRLIDSHNHLQDSRLDQARTSILRECQRLGIVASVVNGSHPNDWQAVLEIANEEPWIVPSIGVHPWHIVDLPKDWFETLSSLLGAIPLGVGEVGIDGWRKEFDPSLQEEVFIKQLELAAALDLPISIHGLRRWGRLLELLQRHPRPRCGFLLHSYGGPIEMVPAFTKLGGYFSCPGFFLKPGREMKLSVFREIPLSRILLETDAPDQNLPEHLDTYRLLSSEDHSTRVNHPANILHVYQGIASLRAISTEALAAQVEINFNELFGDLRARRSCRNP